MVKNILLREKNKYGQFYLLAAVIIISIIIGFAAIQNTAKKRSEVKVYDLGDELKHEGDYVMGYGVLNPTGLTLTELLTDFSSKFSSYAQTPGREIYFVFGNKDKIYVVTYMEIISGTVSLDIGGIGSGIKLIDKVGEVKEYPTGGKDILVIKLGEQDYTFNLKPGENFFFIISQKLQGEDYVYYTK